MRQMDTGQATSNAAMYQRIPIQWYASCEGLWVMEGQKFMPFWLNLPELLHEHLALLPAQLWTLWETAFPTGNLIYNFSLTLFQCQRPYAYQRRRGRQEEVGCPQTMVQSRSGWLAVPWFKPMVLKYQSLCQIFINTLNPNYVGKFSLEAYYAQHILGIIMWFYFSFCLLIFP